MVSKQYTTLSMLLPIAMIFGTSLSIYAYQHSNTLLIIMVYVFGFMVVLIFVIMALRTSNK
jgi:uncharacterized phage infection (PIP) family protein YhgE